MSLAEVVAAGTVTETTVKNFSFSGEILSETVRLYALLPRGKQIHSMCKHSTEEQTRTLLDTINRSQQIRAQGIEMKYEYLKNFCNLVGHMVENLPEDFEPTVLTQIQAVNFIEGAI
jgi:hypothetical protein